MKRRSFLFALAALTFGLTAQVCAGVVFERHARNTTRLSEVARVPVNSVYSIQPCS